MASCGVEQKQRRNLAVSILGLGVVALVVDQAVLRPGDSGPTLASADAVVLETPPAPAKPAPERHSLALRLRQVAGDMDKTTNDPMFMGPRPSPDAFVGPVAWRTAAPMPANEEPRAEKVAADSDAPALTLSSIFNDSHAVINGQTLKVGQSKSYVSENKVRHDVMLVSVDATARRAVVRVNGREFTLVVRVAEPRPQ